MAIFKPEVKKNSGNFTSFEGVCEIGIVGFEDKSEEFDWADLFLNIIVKQKGSDYERTTQIKGSFEKEGGKIVGGSCLKRLYQFFDEIGCDAGITVDGKWEDASGNQIEDIAKYLTDNHLSAVIPGTDPDYNFLGYFYKEQPKTPGAKVYSRMWNKFYKNTDMNKANLKKDAEWMKSKGYIKEMKEGDVVNNSNGNTLSGSGLANL